MVMWGERQKTARRPILRSGRPRGKKGTEENQGQMEGRLG